jgi:hypothetical protein
MNVDPQCSKLALLDRCCNQNLEQNALIYRAINDDDMMRRVNLDVALRL